MEEEVISTWKDIETRHEDLRGESCRKWVFRGQRNYQGQLVPTLERAARRFNVCLDRLPTIERELITEFQRHAHRYISHLPDSEDTLRWLALMQHHGAPTRLLDFTYSFYVAVYFALECARRNDKCFLWAIDQAACWRHASRELPRDLVQEIEASKVRGKTPSLQAKVLETRALTVFPENSFDLDERLAVQQGVFLMPLDIREPFMANLDAVKAVDANGVHEFQISCGLEDLTDCLERLRHMNISCVSLFPGLDGLARSLQNRIHTRPIYDDAA